MTSIEANPSVITPQRTPALQTRVSFALQRTDQRSTNLYLCIHGHFYQPPRMDVITGRIPREPAAYPYANWNERITAECYAPNAEAGNFGRMSFNLGGTLARWLDEYAHGTYERIVIAARNYRAAHGVANGLAQPVHHVILPLARRRDKIRQIRWGIASFEHRFGHRPEGMWLPEMAVDHETLEIMAAEGIRFTILSDEQVRGNLNAGAGPYRVRLSGDREIAVFVRDRGLSNALSFGMPDSAFVDEWLAHQIDQRIHQAGLQLIATDGETFGHHHRQGVNVLSYILNEGEERYGYRTTTLGRYLRENPPWAELEVVEDTAWSCAHRLERWVTGCCCTPGDSRWKGALRRALDNLASDLDHIYLREAERVDVEPWLVQDEYFDVILGRMSQEAFLKYNGLGHLKTEDAQRLLTLLDAQFCRQRMYASCAFFFEELDRPEPRYAIANAVRALALTCRATGDDLSTDFERDLRVAITNGGHLTGADIFNEVVARVDT